MPKLDQIIHNIVLSDGSSVSIEDNSVTVSSGGKTITREFRHPKVSVSSSESGMLVTCDLPRRADKAIAEHGPHISGTWSEEWKKDSNTSYRQFTVTSR